MDKYTIYNRKYIKLTRGRFAKVIAVVSSEISVQNVRKAFNLSTRLIET